MKVSVSWLKDLVEFNNDIDDLAERLSMTGFEVESLEDLSERARNVVIGFVDEIKPHPNAEKLKVCSVDVGLPKKLSIVCGAPNVKAGYHVLVAKVGAYLSANSLHIKLSNLRGVESEGMICSLGELGIESNNEGIEILEENESNVPPIGTNAADYLGLNDTIIELAITANRPDGMSMVGIAREISTITNSKLTLPKLDFNDDFNKFTPKIKNIQSFGSDCIYSLTYIDSIDNTDKINKTILNKLSSLKQNSINPIVDITNYLMLEQGQPLHAFDADLLDEIVGRKVKPNDFGIRNGEEGELFLALDKKEYKLNPNINLITCNDIPIAIAGVIGGNNSSVSDKTTRIWLEAAVFTPTSIRNSSREIGLRTDASSRYEKGISSNMTIAVSKRASQLISLELGGSIKSTHVNNDFKRKSISVGLRIEKINRILGKLISTNNLSDDRSSNRTRYLNNDEIETFLTKLGCQITSNSWGWNVEIPPYRSSDLTREIDLIEEIARLIGYDNFDSNMPDPLEPGVLSPSKLVERRLRNSFIHNGFQEVVTSSLVGPDSSGENAVLIKNPLLTETSRLRTNVWDEHLKILQRNISFGAEGCWIFEIAKTYKKDKEFFVETNLLSGAITGNKRLSKWGVSSKHLSIDYFEARGKLKQSLDVLPIETIDKQLTDKHFMHPGRTAELFVEGKSIGFFGQIHPSLSEKFNLIKETYLFNLEFDPLIKAATRKTNWTRIYKDYPTVPYMERDIALIHSKKHTSLEIINLIKKFGRPLLEKVELIDRYEGSSIPEEEISQAFRIRYRDTKKTLVEEDINPIHEKIRKALKEKLKADLRS
ncbi:phenylalanine--tRNA ligase subunit beta [Prochlorococcus marinus]|uniref:Phenylalanine--tRNA ligase beta subunit n=1 Tax=Prochlorococcus marinus XMU1408 TaxID=2213228 RepID=A0A318RHA2_PROMR|nr:phenylalanine--tRNA ligase subunit beta [Prochlorococcus marinus]MBW3041967.1 phenylalanine--tRNA ligase subunit beta [Prochlorococcus marinus str. XMU1408]PYE03093.1 phenylalanine--tRNA ligase subunit beta [Prochlorococcus marinus XMU1408]